MGWIYVIIAATLEIAGVVGLKSPSPQPSPASGRGGCPERRENPESS